MPIYTNTKARHTIEIFLKETYQVAIDVLILIAMLSSFTSEVSNTFTFKIGILLKIISSIVYIRNSSSLSCVSSFALSDAFSPSFVSVD